jgi:hypothetical protein
MTLLLLRRINSCSLARKSLISGVIEVTYASELDRQLSFGHQNVLAMTLHDCTPLIQATAMFPVRYGSCISNSHLRQLTLAVALESTAATWVPLNVGGRSEEAVNASRPALLAESNTNPESELDVK